jgi:hypothetical protein
MSDPTVSELPGLRPFQPSSAARTFRRAVSRVKGGSGGRLSETTLIENPTRIALAGEALRTDGTTRGRVSGPRLARQPQGIEHRRDLGGAVGQGAEPRQQAGAALRQGEGGGC